MRTYTLNGGDTLVDVVWLLYKTSADDWSEYCEQVSKANDVKDYLHIWTVGRTVVIPYPNQKIA